MWNWNYKDCCSAEIGQIARATSNYMENLRYVRVKNQLCGGIRNMQYFGLSRLKQELLDISCHT